VAVGVGVGPVAVAVGVGVGPVAVAVGVGVGPVAVAVGVGPVAVAAAPGGIVVRDSRLSSFRPGTGSWQVYPVRASRSCARL
jgi:hypothetical protein